MLFKPLACEQCPHYAWEGFMQPQPMGDYGVMLVGEALGAEEAAGGSPFIGRAGGMLNKLIAHAGLSRAGFGIANAVWCRPPDNKLSGMPWEHSAVSECGRRHLFPLLDSTRPKVVVPMGAVALASVLGGRKDILEARGYVWQSKWGLVFPTAHPSFLLRGNGEYGTVVIHDLQRAVELARDGWHPAPTHYTLDPTPSGADLWAQEYEAALSQDPTVRLAYDIETAWGDKGKAEDKEDGVDDDSDASWVITRIGFSYRAHHALSVPFQGPWMPIIIRLLASPGPKVVWNEGFDTPRLVACGAPVLGPIYDGMTAWHVLQSDLRKKLSFVASMVLDDQPPWKHLSAAMPAFYNAGDADVEGRAVTSIFARLHAAGLWPVYDRHVLQIAPLLARMSAAGMPIDQERRTLYARQLAEKRTELLTGMLACVPDPARKIHHVYTSEKVPQQDQNLRSRPIIRQVLCCQTCGTVRPGKSHFRTYKRPTAKKPQNPCAGAQIGVQPVEGIEWFRLAAWTPSTDQLTRYAGYRHHTCPTRRDGQTSRISWDADGVARQRVKYPDDPLYALVLDYRQVDKLAGTYVGRPSGSDT